MYPTHLLRIEGLAVFAAALATYSILEGSLWLLALLALAPDLAMIGYLAGARTGSAVYNAAHTYVAPLALGALGLWAATPLLVFGALVWTAHIGADRAVGYGLKYPTGFSETHLTARTPAPADGPPVAAPEPAD